MSMLGQQMNTVQLNTLLEHIFRRNSHLHEKGLRGTPIMIWGRHGLGKTQTVMDFARRNNWRIAYCAPAQFEEMGDLHGMPNVVDPDEKISGDEYTIYSPPVWVPKDEGPGILLLDDINRADDRILRGVMQLLQNFELQSWKLPQKWQIVATANPDDGDYSVTPMDDAMLTRMLHVSLQFDARSWAEWAQSAGIDKRGIDFVLTYPEVVTGKRTTPRSMVQFFEQIHGIDDLKKELDLVVALSKSALDETTVAAFVNFVNNDLSRLIDPADILGTADIAQLKIRMDAIATDKNGEKRIDRINAICTRLILYLQSDQYSYQDGHIQNLAEFLLMDSIPKDLKMSLHLDLQKMERHQICKLWEKQMKKDTRLVTLLIRNT
jgi:hypothetical protein